MLNSFAYKRSQVVFTTFFDKEARGSARRRKGSEFKAGREVCSKEADRACDAVSELGAKLG